MPNAKLIDNLNQTEYLLRDKVTSIGRGMDNDIVIRNRLVSRHHLVIRRTLIGYVIGDAGSTHKFYINDDRVRVEKKLNNGDRIRVLIIYADEGEKNKDSKKGSSTIAARVQAVAKDRLKGDEENINIGCDYTFEVDGKMLLEKVADMFGKK